MTRQTGLAEETRNILERYKKAYFERYGEECVVEMGNAGWVTINGKFCKQQDLIKRTAQMRMESRNFV